MERRQTRMPRQWLIADERNAAGLPVLLRKLPRDAGVIFLFVDAPKTERRKLLAGVRRIARRRNLILLDELAGDAARVHSLPELRRALLARTPLILLSPMFETRSHPEWKPLPRMRAATFTRLARRRLGALGGMNEKRFAKVATLGFQAWAAIDRFRT
ncbi:hypothetical protein GCM10022276_17800 [Sphingomonas limnosediminicola]|uniref:Uncharacterized protein n=1 Tax=Sphingomonas limnosediminicola TaxID=940133 RepID=A0ABP7LFL8_9SPHN